MGRFTNLGLRCEFLCASRRRIFSGAFLVSCVSERACLALQPGLRRRPEESMASTDIFALDRAPGAFRFNPCLAIVSPTFHIALGWAALLAERLVGSSGGTVGRQVGHATSRSPHLGANAPGSLRSCERERLWCIARGLASLRGRLRVQRWRQAWRAPTVAKCGALGLSRRQRPQWSCSAIVRCFNGRQEWW